MMKRIIAVFAAVAMLLGVCAVASTAVDVPDNVKAYLQLTAGDTGSVAVTSDYKVAISLPTTGEVNTESVSVLLMLKDIASLNISGTRTFSTTLTTGLGSNNVSLSGRIPNVYNFTGSAKVNATVDFENEVTYTASRNGYVLSAAPDTEGAARAAWTAFASHIDVETKTDDDSYAILKNGSYIKMGTEYLHFEGSGDLKIDNLSDRQAIYAKIREALVLETLGDNQNMGTRAVALVKKGTQLAIGTTVATLNEDYMIEIEAVEGGKVRDILQSDVLAMLRSCSGGTDIMINGLALVNSLAEAIQTDGSVDVSLHPVDYARVTASIAPNDSIAVNLRVYPNEGFDSSKFSVEYAFKDNTGTSDISEQPIVVAECAAKEMGDVVNIKVYYDGILFKDVNYSVRTYCENTIAKTGSSVKDVELCKKILDFGAYAEKYFGYTGYTEDSSTLLSNNDVYPKEELPDSVPEDYKSTSTGSYTGKITASLSLESKTELVFHVSPPSGKTVSDIDPVELKLGEKTLESGTDYTVTLGKDDKYLIVTVNGIAAKDLASAYTITVTCGGETKTVTYSALSWAYKMQSNEKAANIAKSLYAYYLAASAS
ncbi:MAG: hypothetical protein J5563_03690 [Clostridia bacterium]|nr:hypothetical protein [Clostridia bacterium]